MVLGRGSIGWFQSQDQPIVVAGGDGLGWRRYLGQHGKGVGLTESSVLKVEGSILLEKKQVLLLNTGTVNPGLASRADSSRPSLTTPTTPMELTCFHMSCCSYQSRMKFYSCTCFSHFTVSSLRSGVCPDPI